MKPSPPDQPVIIAMVATRHRAGTLARLLESLGRQTLRPVAIVVCDNGPDPLTVEAAAKSPLACQVLQPGRNLGYGGGLAEAARCGFAEFPQLTHLLVLDDDAVLSPRDVETLFASSQEHGAGAVAPLLIDPGHRLIEAPEPVSWSLARALRSTGRSAGNARALAPGGYAMAWCVGPCLLVERSTWLQAGPPRADMMAFGDDTEFSLRLSAVSPAWAETSVEVIHDPPPYPGDAAGEREAHYRKFGMLLQNLAFTCRVSPRPRHLPLYLPGNARRFLRTFGFSPRNLHEISRRYLRGFLGRPAGRKA